MNLQDLVDDLAATLGRPVSLEDRQWRLLSYSAHTTVSDEVRRASILARTAPAEIAAWLESLGIDRGGDLVEVPANPELGMVARVCAPVRHRGVQLGYLWVLAGVPPLDEREREALADAARQAGMVLWRHRVLEEEHGRRQGGLLRDLLLNPQPEVRRTASAAIAAEHGWAPDAHYGVLVATVDGAGGDHDARVDELVDVAERARRRWRWGQLLWVLDGAALLVLAQLLPTPDEDLDAAMRVLLDAGATQVAAGAPSDGVLGAHAAFRQARAAQGVLERVPDLGPACRWDRLGSWALVAETLACEEPRTPEPIRRLLEDPGGPALLQALEATLDHGGDVAAIAASLSMHRATLYRRLRRIEEITGLTLARGDDRLVLHLGLRLHRLAGRAA